MLRRLMLCSVFCLSACSGKDTPTAPATAQVAGLWSGTITQTGATGGECLALFQLGNGGTAGITLAITQNGTALTGTATSSGSGGTCTFNGTAGSTNLSLNVTSCQPAGYSVTCNGQLRDVYLAARSVTATISGNTLTGSAGDTWNVFARGTTTNGLGIVTVTNSLTLTR